MPDDLTVDDPFLPLAFSLYSNPGAYAVLAGAGVSSGAGLPTAWAIMTNLINRIAHQQDPEAAPLDADTVSPWYEKQFGVEPTYSGVLEQLARTPYEREALLRSYFESDEEAPADEVPPMAPSSAHRAVASLMEQGVIRVVVTLNFDRLFETALRERGIEPVIVSTDADAQGLRSLHTVDHCVVHLHGDYRNATSMRNTTAELEGYTPHIRQLLDRILDDYGLLIAGWSAQHDRALREAVASRNAGHFTTGWIEPHTPTSAAQQLIVNGKALLLTTTADDALGRLDDAVIAMRARGTTRHPLSLTVAANRIKRDLHGDSPAITAHDLIAAEFARLEAMPAFHMASHHNFDRENYGNLVDEIHDASQVAVGCVATLAYWGDTRTDQWWLPEVERFARPARSNGGSVPLIELPRILGVRLFYAAGIAAVAAKRYDLLALLLRLPARTSSGPTSTAAELLDWYSVHAELNPDAASSQVSDTVIEVLGDVLGLGAARIDDAWQEFDTLRAAAQILEAPEFSVEATSYMEATVHFEQSHTAEATKTALAAQRTSAKRIGAMCRLHSPHVLVADSRDPDGRRWVSGTVDRLLANAKELAPLAMARSSADEHLVMGTEGAVEVALIGALAHFEDLAQNHRWDATPVGSAGFLPSEFWLDTGEPPEN